MRLWDSDLLTLKKVDIVRDGLLSWIDFRDPISVTSSSSDGATEGTIVDRATGLSATIAEGSSSQNSGSAWFEQHNGLLIMHAGTDSSLSYAKKLILPATVNGCKSFEIVFNPPSSGKYDKLNFIETCIRKTSQNYISYFQTFGATNNKTGGIYPVHIFAQIGTSNTGAGYVNGSRVGSGRLSSGSYNIKNLFDINLVGVDSTQLLRVGSIRLYNRNFNGDELAQNVQYEVMARRLSL